MDGAVGDGGESLVVGHDDEGLSELVAQVEEELVEFCLVLGVEAARGFVGEDDRGVVDQCPCHGYALFLTAREFGGLVVGAVAQSHEGEQFFGAFLRLPASLSGDEGGNHDVLQGGELREELVELEHETQVLVAEVAEFPGVEAAHVDAVHGDAALVGLVEGSDDLEQCGLAGSAGADDAHHLSFVNMQVDALEHLQGAEALGYSFDVNHYNLQFTIYNFLPPYVSEGKIKQNNWKQRILLHEIILQVGK